MTYPSFAMELNEAEHYLKSLGCDWSVKGKLSRSIGRHVLNANVQKANY